MKKILLVVLMISIVVLSTSCLSNKEIEIAESLNDSIDSIGNITLDSIPDIYEINEKYNKLSDEQKEQVTNYDILERAIIKAKKVIETKDDPSQTINMDEMIGIWEGPISDARTSTIGISDSGVYYYSTKDTSNIDDLFTSKYEIATSVSLDGYDVDSEAMSGNFYSFANDTNYSLTIIKSLDGQLSMNISGETIDGYYTKTTKIVNNSKKKVCAHSGCTKKVVKSGDSIYCSEHSNECAVCGCYIDEDALVCLNCIAKSLNKD